jgi:malonyl-CoA O-methyltransferase
MFDRLELVKIAALRVLDAGCGAGADLARCKNHIRRPRSWAWTRRRPCCAAPGAGGQGVVAEPVAQPLLPAKAGVDLLCGDFGPAARTELVDLVWSNLALHWHPQPDRVFAEWRRVLRVDGLLMFSCFGPDTFRELRAAFAEADAPRTRCLSSTCTTSATSWWKSAFRRR